MEKVYDKTPLKEQTIHGTVSFPLASYRNHGKVSYSLKSHWHDEFEIIYMQSGRFLLKINMQEFALEAPAMAFVEPGAIHSLQMLDHPEESALVFDMKMLSFEYFDSVQYQVIRPILEGKIHFPQIFHPQDAGWPQAVEIYRGVFGQAGRTDMASRIRIKSCLYQLLALLYEQGWLREDQEEPREDPARLETMKKVLQEIHTNYGQRLTLNALASMAGMNPQYFCRYFKRLTGKNTTAYLNEIRIDRAAELLVKSQDRIIDVAGVCGFENMGYFIKRFKEQKGSTPSEYREKYQKESVGRGG